MTEPRRDCKAEHVPPDRLGSLLVFSMRYALGRMTYAPSLVAEAIRAHGAVLSPGDREVIARDIDEAEARGDLGWDCDAKVWRELREWLRNG